MGTKTVTVNGWIVFDSFRASCPNIWDTPFAFREYEPDAESDCIKIAPHSFSFEAPTEFDPRPEMVVKLQEKIRSKNAEAAKFEADTRRKISELLALTNEVAV